MRSSMWLLVAALCSCAPAPTPTAAPMPAPAPVPVPQRPLLAPRHAVAGAEQCWVVGRDAVDAAFERRSELDVAFGTRGGLAVTASGTTMTAWRLDRRGRIRSSIPLMVDGVRPHVHVMPTGFVVRYWNPPRERLGDITNFALHVDLEGEVSAPITLTEGTLVAATEGDDGVLFFTAEGELLSVSARAGALRVKRRGLEAPGFVAPVQGPGRAAFLLGTRHRLHTVVTADTTRSLTGGSIVPEGGGGMLDARFVAIRGPAGAIQLAWQAWMIGADEVRYGVVRGSGEVARTGSSRAQREGIRAPFHRRVFARASDDGITRQEWPELDLTPTEVEGLPERRVNSGVAWTGDAHVLVVVGEEAFATVGLTCPLTPPT